MLKVNVYSTCCNETIITTYKFDPAWLINIFSLFPCKGLWSTAGPTLSKNDNSTNIVEGNDKEAMTDGGNKRGYDL